MDTSPVVDGAAPEAVPPLVNGDNDAAPETGNSGIAAEEGEGETVGGGGDVERFRHQVDDIKSQVDELEHRVNGVVQYYSSKKQQPNGSKVGSSVMKDKEKEKPIENNHKKQMDSVCSQAACTKRMQELMRQFCTIFRHIKNHKWAWPFQHPVDVEGLGLHDYYEVIKKPMDFDTIQRRMEAKDGTGYKNVRDMYADVHLVFTNALTYNEEGSDVHMMAKTVLEKFEERWLLLLPKVIEEETRRKEEEAQAQEDMQIAQEAAIAKMARDTSHELSDLYLHLDELREMAIQKCRIVCILLMADLESLFRKMSAEEKRKLGVGLSRLSPEDLNKALEIIAQDNPGFQATAEEVDLDMDAQTESTLRRLKFFVKGALEVQAKSSASKSLDNSKRKREICDALAKTAKKRSKKLPV